ncbi:MAG: hypothetical protein ABI411_10820 [Tahibacter sp.]
MSSRPLFLAIALTFCASAFAGSGPDIDKVNGAIHLESGQVGGDLSTVNGSIRMDAHATADDLETVNGSIDIGDDSNAQSLETVNGAIEIGARTRIARGVEAVNGSITLAEGADVNGKLSNVNGRIEVSAAHVGGGIETVAGDIELGANARVDGGILVEKPSGWSWGKQKTPRVVIGPHAVVNGSLVFQREVELLVSDSASIGTVTGATATKFSGEHPGR